MKFAKILLISSIVALTSQAYGACPEIEGNYRVFSQLLGGQEGGTYGKLRITEQLQTQAQCIYAVKASVNEYAAPLQQGFQFLILNPVDGGIGFSLTDRQGAVRGAGEFFLGFEQLILSQKLEGCGGEGGPSSLCGVDVILRPIQ